jgi:hypothetical protein
MGLSIIRGGEEDSSLIVSTLACLGLGVEQGGNMEGFIGDGSGVYVCLALPLRISALLLVMWLVSALPFFDSWTSSFFLVYLWVRYIWG